MPFSKQFIDFSKKELVKGKYVYFYNKYGYLYINIGIYYNCILTYLQVAYRYFILNINNISLIKYFKNCINYCGSLT